VPDVIEGTGDVDGDGILNFLDLDSDGDGASDRDEWSFGYDPYDANDTPVLPVRCFLSAFGLCSSAFSASHSWRPRDETGKP
jgi:hypothetical protein